MRVTNAPGGGRPLHIEVVGEQYWWRVRYAADGDRAGFTTANEIQVPIGRPVHVSVASADVIHSFWIPNLAGKIDMIPGRVNTLTFRAERAGVYRGVCTEFCGDQHARMAFDVVTLEPAAFDDWRARQAGVAREPPTPFLATGQTLFMRGGCGNCHAIRGTDARGDLGPDLTHVGSRRSIGAAQFPNNVGTLAGWISDVQHLKGGVRMPSYGSYTGEELRAIAGYMESLK
jgi:cytochrome c oxidase subunit II